MSVCVKRFGVTLADEALSNEDLIREKYQGIRPAPGYPACPEHTEKGPLWELMNVEEKHWYVIDIELCDVPRCICIGLVLLAS